MRAYYEEGGIAIYHGDCREILPALEPVDLVLTDPPYGETSLKWDKRVDGWTALLPTKNLWCFGSLRFFMEQRELFEKWTLAQDIIWEKHNGSNFHADRFRRIHEHVVQFYRGGWPEIFKNPVTTPDASQRTLRRKTHPAHTRHVKQSASYVSEDGGPRLQRSIITVRSAHGYAQHPTQKPVGIVTPLLQYSCPPGGSVLDPFMGSGTTLRAAKDLGLRAIGIELEEKYCEVAVKRLAQEMLSFD